eukprot:3760-Pyramimonas_sp.AAC.1
MIVDLPQGNTREAQQLHEHMHVLTLQLPGERKELRHIAHDGQASRSVVDAVQARGRRRGGKGTDSSAVFIPWRRPRLKERCCWTHPYPQAQQ